MMQSRITAIKTAGSFCRHESEREIEGHGLRKRSLNTETSRSLLTHLLRSSFLIRCSHLFEVANKTFLALSLSFFYPLLYIFLLHGSKIVRASGCMKKVRKKEKRKEWDERKPRGINSHPFSFAIHFPHLSQG